MSPRRLVLRIALTGAGTVLASLALLLLVIVATVVFSENHPGLENDSCTRPEELERTILLVLVCAGLAAAAGAVALASRSVRRDVMAVLAAAIGVLVVIALGASLAFMLDPGPAGPCSKPELDRAQWLFGVTGTMAAIATLSAAIWLLRRSIGGSRRPPRRLAVAVAAALALWACAWWMFTVLSSAD